MKISDFLKGRNVEYQTVYRYISRHETEFKELIRKNGKEYELSDEAIKILEEVYPLPNPTVIVNGVPFEEHEKALNELMELQKKVISMQDKMMELSANQLLLEDREKRLLLLQDENNDLVQKVTELSVQLEHEKSKSWWDKLRKK